MQKRKHEPIPEGWAQDCDGKITTDAEIGYDSKRLMPLGGSELTSGYKGYGLAMLVEILCGVLAGSAYGPNIRQWGDASIPANLGHCFIAIDPNCFAPGFGDRLDDLTGYLRNMNPVREFWFFFSVLYLTAFILKADSFKPVLVAGDPERIHMEAVDKAGGVRYVQDQHDTCQKLSETLKVKPLVSS